MKIATPKFKKDDIVKTNILYYSNFKNSKMMPNYIKGKVVEVVRSEIHGSIEAPNGTFAYTYPSGIIEIIYLLKIEGYEGCINQDYFDKVEVSEC